MTPSEKEIAFGNRILAQMGSPPMTPEQQTRFLAKREERAALAIAYQSNLWFRGCIAALILGGGAGFYFGRKSK